MQKLKMLIPIDWPRYLGFNQNSLNRNVKTFLGMAAMPITLWLGDCFHDNSHGEFNTSQCNYCTQELLKNIENNTNFHWIIQITNLLLLCD